MEVVQTGIRANSQDSGSKISDQVEANVGLGRRDTPAEGKIEFSLVL